MGEVRSMVRMAFVGIALSAGVFAVPGRAVAATGATLVVNAVDDSVDAEGCEAGHCSLREAIQAANAGSGADTIEFDIPDTGIQTISPLSGLPVITGPVTIDGTTQPGFRGSPVIELDGSTAGLFANGLTISGGSSTVRGMAINRFSLNGIALDTAGSSIIEGNYIGTDPAGSADLGNTIGITVESASNTIGGAAAAARNLISGNESYGVWLREGGSTNNQVLGNYIGTNAAGTADLGNGGDGIIIGRASSNTIGGTAARAGNVISGNGSSGVLIDGYGSGSTGSLNNQVLGNYIGTNAAGTAGLGNDGDGVSLTATASANTVGGMTAGAGNLISGNGSSGVRIDGTGTTNRVLGNYIGTDGGGTAPLGNTLRGIRVGGMGNIIGGTAAGAGNTVAFNGTGGVEVVSGLNHSIRGNSIFSNAGLGIDLSGNGLTPNDFLDGDDGPNHLQNFPVLTFAGSNAGSTAVQGTLNSTANTAFDIDIYSSSVCGAAGHGEGKALMASTTAATNNSWDASFWVSFPTSSLAGNVITATATDPEGNTSEFSACYVAEDPPRADLALAMADTPDPATAGTVVTYHITVRNGGPNVATGVSVTDTLSPKLIYQSVVPSQGSCTRMGTTVTCDLGTVAGHATPTIDITVIATTAGVTKNSANVTSDGTDPDPGNNWTTSTTTVAPNGDCTVMGTSGDDLLKGTSGDDVICGLGGADTILAGTGDDSVFGGDGDDVIKGAIGSDILRGEAGHDFLVGGLGSDTLDGGDGDDTLRAKDSVSGNDSVDGGDGNDACKADSGDTVVNCP